MALDRFRERMDRAVDLSDPRHRAVTLQWLRDWGCRSLRREDDRRSSNALRLWWRKWSDALPSPDVTLDSLADDGLEVGAEAFGDVSTRIGPRRQLSNRLTDVHLGPTTAKTMYAVRSSAFMPWDDAIRKTFGYGGDSASYLRALVRARDELAEAVQCAGIDARDVPTLIGRPKSTPPKLVDEQDWVRYTKGHEPPAREELEGQVAIEYDPQPPLNSGSPTKANASTLRLARRILMGDRPVRYFAEVTGEAMRARLRRARRAISDRRQRRHSPRQVTH